MHALCGRDGRHNSIRHARTQARGAPVRGLHHNQSGSRPRASYPPTVREGARGLALLRRSRRSHAIRRHGRHERARESRAREVRIRATDDRGHRSARGNVRALAAQQLSLKQIGLPANGPPEALIRRSASARALARIPSSTLLSPALRRSILARAREPLVVSSSQSSEQLSTHTVHFV